MKKGIFPEKREDTFFCLAMICLIEYNLTEK